MNKGIKFDIVSIVTMILLSVFFFVLLYCMIYYPPQISLDSLKEVIEAGKKVGDSIGK